MPVNVLGDNEMTIDTGPVLGMIRVSQQESAKLRGASLGSVTIIRYRSVASNIVKRQAGFADVEPCGSRER